MTSYPESAQKVALFKSSLINASLSNKNIACVTFVVSSQNSTIAKSHQGLMSLPGGLFSNLTKQDYIIIKSKGFFYKKTQIFCSYPVTNECNELAILQKGLDQVLSIIKIP
jgi:hypothetical protein